MSRSYLFFIALLWAGFAFGESGPFPAPLPPTLAWSGTSEDYVADPGSRWITPAEESGFDSTPTYEETFEWISKLTAASPFLSRVSIGTSPEGRDIPMVVASATGADTPAELRRSQLPILLAQAGIHSGEIDGKDAGMMLLRDLMAGGRSHALLDRASLLFIPILNVDGHERRSPFGRINQRGPSEMGWRTNARNLNLNRDYSKLDTNEVRAAVEVIHHWNPDLYVDLHVTDGLDYQYDITWGSSAFGYSPETAVWMEKTLDPQLRSGLRAAGHIPGPLVFPPNWGDDLSRGLREWRAGPRFSDSYGGIRHTPTILVENHSLKPYRQRVLGTRVLLDQILTTLGAHGTGLRSAIESDREQRPLELPLTWKSSPESKQTLDFLAIESRRRSSRVSGTETVEWTGKPLTVEVEMELVREPDIVASRPSAYLVPPAWSDVVDRLRYHGIQVVLLTEDLQIDVEMYRIEDPKFATAPYEGRFRVSGTPTVDRRQFLFPAGTVRVSTDQPLGDLAMMLLEPHSPDSFLQWGFFNSIFTRTEYAEGYVIDPLAEQMMAADPELELEFNQKLESDPQFADSPSARRSWFYRKTPYWDERYQLYPVARIPD